MNYPMKIENHGPLVHLIGSSAQSIIRTRAAERNRSAAFKGRLVPKLSAVALLQGLPQGFHHPYQSKV